MFKYKIIVIRMFRNVLRKLFKDFQVHLDLFKVKIVENK